MTSPTTVPKPLSPPRPARWGLRLVIVVAVAAIAAAIWFAVTHPWGTQPGPLGNGGLRESVANPRTTGHVWVFGQPVAYNDAAKPAVLQKIALVKPYPGIHVVGTYVSGPKRKMLSLDGWNDWPTKEYQDVHPVAGFRVAPRKLPAGDRGVELIFVLRIDKPGRYEAPGVVVDYTVDGKHYRRYLGIGVAACVSKPRKKDGCHPPEPIVPEDYE